MCREQLEGRNELERRLPVFKATVWHGGIGHVR